MKVEEIYHTLKSNIFTKIIVWLVSFIFGIYEKLQWMISTIVRMMIVIVISYVLPANDVDLLNHPFFIYILFLWVLQPIFYELRSLYHNFKYTIIRGG